jgi:ketosteroid isomerase-like protein
MKREEWESLGTPTGKMWREARNAVLACAVIAGSILASSVNAAGAEPAADVHVTPAPATEAVDVEVIHNQLRAVRDAILEAWKRRDIDAVLSHVDPDVVVTWQNGTVSRGPEAIRKFYDEMLVGEGSVLSGVESTFAVDDLSVLHGMDTAIAFGTIHDDVSFKRSATAAFIGAGSKIGLDSRWTATLVRKAGDWKLASYHVSANIFSNPVLALGTKAAGRVAGIGGFAIGVVLALLVGWLVWRRKPKAA